MKRMQQMRLERGWSRAELARRARMDPSDVGRIENGLMRPYPSQAVKLAHAHGVAKTESNKLTEEAR